MVLALGVVAHRSPLHTPACCGGPCHRPVPAPIGQWHCALDAVQRQALETVHPERAADIPLGQHRSSIAERRALRRPRPGPARAS